MTCAAVCSTTLSNKRNDKASATVSLESSWRLSKSFTSSRLVALVLEILRRIRMVPSDGIEVRCSLRVRVSWLRSEEHTSELQSLMRISYAVFCLKKKKTTTLHYGNNLSQ